MPRSKNVDRDLKICELHRQGLRDSEIARELGVSRATVSRVLTPGPEQSPVVDLMRRIERLELEASLLAECMYWFSKIPSPWGQHLYQRVRSILCRWPTPLMHELYQNEKLDLHTGYIRSPER
jgi:transcriptional regulator with XRE-family HTH domain